MKTTTPALLLGGAVFRTVFADVIGSQGYHNYSTAAFILQLDTATGVATSLVSLPGRNAGADEFNFLLPTVNRTGDGHYFLGDIQLRFRHSSTSNWTDVSSHYARNASKTGKPQGNQLATADLTPSLGAGLPLSVQRTWIADNDSVILQFKLSNTGNSKLEIGGLGMPLSYNDNWIGDDTVDTWTQHVVSDPAMSLDAGYVVTNRLTGLPPTLVTVPVDKTPLEQYRLNFVTQPDYPEQWLDKAALDYNYEGIFSWWTSTSGLLELDNAAASSYGFPSRGQYSNAATSSFIKPGASKTVALRIFTAAGPRAVEDRLAQFDRPTIVGVPGFVASAGETVKMVIRSTSPPSIGAVAPSNIAFAAVKKISPGVYSIAGTVKDNTYGQTRVTINFGNGDVGIAHYTIIKPAAAQLDSLGEFRFGNQFYDNTSDYFGRGPGIITYDNEKKEIVLDDPRAWVAGISDEAGSGAYVSASAKQLGRPLKSEIAKLEQFAKTTLFGRIQNSQPGANYSGVRRSLFYYEANLEPLGVYNDSIDHSGTWDKAYSLDLTRSYNYPHPCVLYWTLYRLARNYVGLTTIPWHWYLDRAYDTIMGMQKLAGVDTYAEFGLMEGSYFLQVLLDLQREGATNATLANHADKVQAFMKTRADIWKSEQFPYASEFPWDNTAQEEVYFWSDYFGDNSTASSTIETLMAVMASVPDWAYSGTGRDLWDFQFSGQIGPGARLERLIHHYKGAQSAYPLVNQFQANPTDIHMLRAGYGGVLGPLTSIDEEGFGATGFHSRPDYLNWDPLSGDNGVTIALHSLSTRAIIVNDKSLGGWSGFGATVSQSGSVITAIPTDSSQQRFFNADNALYMELDSGKFSKVAYDTSSRQVSVTFAPSDSHTPKARIRWSTTASTPNSAQYQIQGKYKTIRGCSVIPLSKSGTTTVKFAPK